MSPYLDGRRCTLEEWYAAHPQRPVFGSAGADEREAARLRGERDDAEEVTQRVIADMETRTAAARAAVAAAMGVTVDDPALAEVTVDPDSTQFDRNDPFGDDPPWIVPVEHEPVDRSPVRAGLQPDDVAVDAIPSPAARSGDPRRARVAEATSKPLTASADGAAGRFSRKHGLPAHSKSRPSQLPGGRHSRYVRSVARAANVTDEVADRDLIAKHPPTCPYRTKS